jgi:CHAT domain-containing protein
MATLSACETALGRVDISDNPRGLVSALMLGGAQSVVGTLWEVDDAAAQTFFSHLYERLADGSSRVEAFHAARMRAWERHPLPCDWGAFVYLGY